MPNHVLQKAGFTPANHFTEIRCNFECYGTDLGSMRIGFNTATLLLVAGAIIQCEEAA